MQSQSSVGNLSPRGDGRDIRRASPFSESQISFVGSAPKVRIVRYPTQRSPAKIGRVMSVHALLRAHAQPVSSALCVMARFFASVLIVLTIGAATAAHSQDNTITVFAATSAHRAVTL